MLRRTHFNHFQVMSKAPLYFKQALEHAESEWSQHHAKAVIDTKAKVGFTHTVCLGCGVRVEGEAR